MASANFDLSGDFFGTFDVSNDPDWEYIDEVRITGSDLDIDIDDLDVSSAVVPPDSDGNLTAAGGVTEPVGLDTAVDTAGEAVDVFDFTLSDGGTSDGVPMDVSQIAVNVSGTSTDAERDRVTWRLNGPDAGNVAGSYDAGTDTLTFSGLNISVADGGSETYTVNAYYNDNTNLAEDNTIILSVDGDTDVTVDAGGTQMGSTAAVDNDTGTTIDVVATELAFTTQPAGSVSGSALTTQPVVAAQDASGNIDVDFTETITLTEASAGSLSGNTQAASNGVATFTGLTYTATADQESFTLTADDEDGAGSDLPAADANAVTSDVVATDLNFTAQPSPTTLNSGVTTGFTTVPEVTAVDDDGLVDTGYGTDITLAEVNGNGSAELTATGDTDGNAATVSITPSNGVSTFTGMQITYSNTTASESFNLRASSGALTVEDSTAITSLMPPTVSDANIDIAGATGTGGAYKIGDTVTATWDNTDPGGDANDSVGSVDVDFSEFGGGAPVAATNSGDIWTATYTIQAGSIDTSGANVSVTVTNAGGTTTTADTSNATVDNQAPSVASVDPPADGTYGEGEDLDFTVNYSEGVTVDGTPRLALTIGSSTRYADYVSGSATALLFRYTVQSSDNDSDGIELNPALNTNVGTIRDPVGNEADTALGANDLSGVVTGAVDTDGDGVSDAQEDIDGTDPNDPDDYLDETPPVVTAPADRVIDAVGLHTPMTLRRLLGLPAGATDEQVQQARDALATDNIDGADCCNTQAEGLENGRLLLPPGQTQVVWRGSDRKGNTGQDTQTVSVRPLVSLAKDQTGVEGGQVDLRFFLSGPSPFYPLDIPYRIDTDQSSAGNADHDLTDGIVTFAAGETEASVTVDLADDMTPEGDETLVVRLDDHTSDEEDLADGYDPSDIHDINSAARTRHVVTITEDNLAPAVDLTLQQGATDTALVVAGDGNVTATAGVTDPNAGDTHTYDWSASESQLVDIDGDSTDATFVFDPALLNAGVYAMRVTVTDSGGETATGRLHFRVAAEAPALDPLDDTDGDGVDDQTEGFGDSDGDGIPDYLDNIEATNVLPETAAVTDAYLMECDPGVRCRLGRFALAGETGGARLAGDALPDDAAFDNAGGLFDFEAHGLPVSGQSVRVVIPQTAAVPDEAVYRKFAGNQWFTFEEDDENAVHSAAGEPGHCPPPGDSSWEEGLTAGDFCVQLTIEDGGPNDADGLANGSVADPGGVAAPADSDSSGGGNTESRTISGQTKGGGGVLGPPAGLLLLLLALLRGRRRAAGLCGLLAAVCLLSPAPAIAGESEGWLRHFKDKTYITAGLYRAEGDQDRGDFTGAMAADNVDVAVQRYEVLRSAYQVSLGYRYYDNMGVEFGYMDLGEVDFEMSTEADDAAAVSDALLRHLPFSGDGWVLANRFDYGVAGSWRASVETGVFSWEDKVSISRPGTGGGSRDGTDPLLGLGIAYSLDRGFAVRLQYRRVFFDDQGVTLWGGGLSKRF